MVAGELAVLLFLLFLSGFFASAEVAFFGLNAFLLERKKGKVVNLIKRLLERPVDLIITILVGNEVVNILISAVGTKLLQETVGDAGVALGTVLITLAIFYFGEVIPKNVALQMPGRLATLYALPIYLFQQAIFPLRFVFKKLFGNLIEKVESGKEQVLSVEELLFHLEENYRRGHLSKEELEMVKRALEISETTVEEIMTPRTDIFALEETKKVGEVIDDIVREAHSKVPLYLENLDSTTGILYTKSLLPVEDNLERRLTEFRRPVGFIPQILTLEDLIEEFKAKKTQIFMVVDEHGGTAGLVTYSDFLSWLLGEMVEEWNREQEIKELGRGVYLVDASVNIELLAERLGLKLPEDYEYSTLGGYLIAHFKGLPPKGATIEVGGFRFTVQEIENNRIKWVKITRLGDGGEG
ncbi:MAG: HlyC/CorC family transporter [Aquificae bacterium]|nr:HlyC/CorC family transporter [Aquificota bacterium]